MSIQKKFKGPLAYMAGHSVAANLIMALCLVGGLISLMSIKQEIFPNIALDNVIVSVPYPGAGPEEVEDGIILAVEEAVRGLDGVAEIESTAFEGRGNVVIELLEGSDLQKLAREVKSEIDRITTFPGDAEEPEVSIMSHKRKVLSIILYGDQDEKIMRELAEQTRDNLLQAKSITQIEFSGVRGMEISVEVPEDNLRTYGLTLNGIADKISKSSIELPGGGIKTDDGEILIRMKDRRDYGREFAQLPILTTASGSQVLLGDIAEIKDGFEDVDLFALYNGKRSIRLDIYRVGNQTPLQVSKAVRNVLEHIETILPPGINAEILNDRSERYRQRVELLVKNGLLGLVLVLIILGLFLELRLAFWVMMGIPISFLGSFLVLPYADVTINMISLFAYIVALGIVVDDAIVVGENIYHHHQDGQSFLSSAINGVREVATPVIFSILTNIVAFLPLYFVPGSTGKIFKNIPVVVICVFVISLIESLFILPAHLAHQKDRVRSGLNLWIHNSQQRFSTAFKKWVKYKFGPSLEIILRWRYFTICTAVAILIIALTYAGSGRMGFSLFPKVEGDTSDASVTLPYGAPAEKTELVMRKMISAADKVKKDSGHPELVKGIFAQLGNGGSHQAEVTVYLADPEIRDEIMSTQEFTRRWRKELGDVAGVDIMKFQSDRGGPGAGASLTIELSHRNTDILNKASKRLAKSLLTYPLVTDVDDGVQEGKTQIDYKITPEGERLGLTASSIARQLRNSFYGAEAIRQQRNRNEIKIMVRLPKEERVSEYDLDEMIIRTPENKEVQLREVVTTKHGLASANIIRRNGRRAVQISADVVPHDRAGEIIAALKKKELLELKSMFPGLTYSFEGHQAEMRDSLSSLKINFLIALLAIFALLAIPFRSYLQPLIVMLSIPFGIVGAILGHIIMGYSLCIPSMFGIIALAGIVVNDSLVLISFSNEQQRIKGLNTHDAIVSAAIQRFRPIILTTITTFCGLAPMIFERSLQARFLIPMAISLGYGILFATLITLVLIPCLIMAMDDIKKTGIKVN